MTLEPVVCSPAGTAASKTTGSQDKTLRRLFLFPFDDGPRMQRAPAFLNPIRTVDALLAGERAERPLWVSAALERPLRALGHHSLAERSERGRHPRVARFTSRLVLGSSRGSCGAAPSAHARPFWADPDAGRLGLRGEVGRLPRARLDRGRLPCAQPARLGHDQPRPGSRSARTDRRTSRCSANGCCCAAEASSSRMCCSTY